MNSRNIIVVLSMAFLLMISACEPVEVRDMLSNPVNSADDIILSVEQEAGSNSFTLQMNTPGVTGYWDYIVGTKYSDRVDVVFPVTGEFTFNFHMTTPFMPNGDPGEREYITNSIVVKVDKLDVPLADEYYALAGTTAEGKTWVFDGEPFDGKAWWYMVADYNHAELWWNAAGECCPPADINFVQDAAATMNFNLLGEYTYELNGEKSEGVKWVFSEDLKSLTISDPTAIPGYQNEWGEPRANPKGTYEIIELTEDKLVLFTSTTIQGGSGWKWVFKPAE